MKKVLPKELYRYFWEVEPSKIDVEQRPEYVISRLMDYGHTEAVRWMRSEYGDEAIKRTLQVTRGISRPSAYYWSRVIGMATKEVRCLQTPYRQIPYGV